MEIDFSMPLDAVKNNKFVPDSTNSGMAEIAGDVWAMMKPPEQQNNDQNIQGDKVKPAPEQDRQTARILELIQNKDFLFYKSKQPGLTKAANEALGEFMRSGPLHQQADKLSSILQKAQLGGAVSLLQYHEKDGQVVVNSGTYIGQHSDGVHLHIHVMPNGETKFEVEHNNPPRREVDQIPKIEVDDKGNLITRRKDGTTESITSIAEDGTGTVTIFRADGVTREASNVIRADGSYESTLYGKDGKTVTSTLSKQKDGSSVLTEYNADGSSVSRASDAQGETRCIQRRNANNRLQSETVFFKDGQTTVALYDKNGERLGQALYSKDGKLIRRGK